MNVSELKDKLRKQAEGDAKYEFTLFGKAYCVDVNDIELRKLSAIVERASNMDSSNITAIEELVALIQDVLGIEELPAITVRTFSAVTLCAIECFETFSERNEADK